MKRLISWLSATEVPRWQLALGFLLASFVTASSSYVTSQWTAERQDAIAEIAKFRQSAGQLDIAASALVDAVVDKKDASSARTTFRQTVLLNLRDLEGLQKIVKRKAVLAEYSSALSEVRVASDNAKDVEHLKPYFLGMAQVRRKQLSLLAEADDYTG